MPYYIANAAADHVLTDRGYWRPLPLVEAGWTDSVVVLDGEADALHFCRGFKRTATDVFVRPFQVPEGVPHGCKK